MRFENKVALVTGAASGLGRATSLRLASEGAKVFGVDLNGDGLTETQTLVADAGGTMEFVVANLTNRDEAHAAVAAAVGEFDQLDVVTNIAGVLRAGHLVDMTQEDFDMIFGVNVEAMYWITQAAVPHLLETRGNVVNIASNAGLMGQAYTSLYSASKGAVVNLTRALAMEFVKSPIRVNAVAPGGIKTPMAIATVFPDDTDWKLMAPSIGFRDMSEPEEIAAVIAFVASDDASAVHGSIVSADSGLTAG